MGQVDVNRQEAQSPSLFVSGWRPAVGWMCVNGLAYQFLIWPIANGICRAMGLDMPFPQLDTDVLMTLLLGMLGLGGMRSFEKLRGVAR